MKMKAITLHQPFASLVAGGLKTYETRSWRTDYRGPLAIHAAMIDKPIPWEIETKLNSMVKPYDFVRMGYPLGAVLAVVDLVDVVVMDAGLIAGMDGNNITFGDWSPGRFAWRLENPRRIKPYYIRGQQGIWNLSQEHVDKLEYI